MAEQNNPFMNLPDKKQQGGVVEDNPFMNLPDKNQIDNPFLNLPDAPKQEQSFEQMSPLNKTIDILNRPSYGVKSVISEMQKQSPTLRTNQYGLPIYSNPLPAEKPVSIPERFKAFGRGFTGQERVTFNQLYEKAGIKGVPGLGFASEVAIDPLTYVSGPIAKGLLKIVIKPGISKVAQVGTKVVEDISKQSPMLGEMLGKSGEAVAGLANQVKKAFVNSTGIPVLDQLIKKNTLEKEYLKGQALSYGIKVRNAIQNIAKKTGRTVDDISGEIVNLVENPIGKGKVAKSQQLKLLTPTGKGKVVKLEDLPLGGLDQKLLYRGMSIDEFNKGGGGQSKTIEPDEAVRFAQRNAQGFYGDKGGKGVVAVYENGKITKHYLVDAKRNITKLSTPTGKEAEIANTGGLIPETAAATIPETKLVANLLSNRFNRLLEKEIKAGVPVSALRGELGYFPRYTSDQVKEYFSKAGQSVGAGSKVWNMKLKESLARKTGDWTLEEVNQFAKDVGMPSLGGKKVEEFFLKNPAYASAIRGVSSAKAVTSAQFLDETGKIFGQPINKAPQFWEEAPEALQKMMPSLKGKKFDPEVISEINRVYTKILNPKETEGFVKMFDTVQNYWKAWTLSIFPKYHLRNVLGNVWNNYLAGVVDPSVYAEAGALQAYRKSGNLRYLDALKIPKDQADEILLQAEKSGVLGQGFYGGDIPKAIEQAVTPTSKNLLSQQGAVIKFGKGVGTTLENNARLAHFVDRLSKGDTAEDAALSVKKFLFDYGDLTPFEKDIMKRLFPFYTWTRKNIPLQVEQLIKNPQKFIPLEKTLVGRNEKDLRRLNLTNPSLAERLPVELGRTDKTVSYIPLEGLVPASDLSKIFRPQELFVELLSPYIKTPIELMMNKSFYTEKEIQNPNIPNETREFLRMDIPNKWKYALTSIYPQARMLNEINKFIKKKEKNEPLNRNEQLFSTLLGSVYKMNLKDLKLKAYGVVEKKINEVENAYEWAKRNKREDEAARMKTLLKQTIKEIKNIR